MSMDLWKIAVYNKSSPNSSFFGLGSKVAPEIGVGEMKLSRENNLLEDISEFEQADDRIDDRCKISRFLGIFNKKVDLLKSTWD